MAGQWPRLPVYQRFESLIALAPSVIITAKPDPWQTPTISVLVRANNASSALLPPMPVMPFITATFGVPDPATTHPDAADKRRLGFDELNHRRRRQRNLHSHVPSDGTTDLQQRQPQYCRHNLPSIHISLPRRSTRFWMVSRLTSPLSVTQPFETGTLILSAGTRLSHCSARRSHPRLLARSTPINLHIGQMNSTGP